MKATLFWIALCLAPATASAVKVYACKGKNGETVYTNVQCPDPGTTKEIGSYTQVPDDPRQMRAAAMEAARINARNAAAAEVESYSNDAAATSYPTTPASSAQKNINGLAEHYRRRSDPLPKYGKDRTESGSYVNDLSEGHEHKGMQPQGKARRYIDDSSRDFARPTTSESTSSITDCRVGAAGGVACYDSNGNASFGNVRNGAVFDSNGNAQYLQRNGNGQLQTDDGTCVKDIYGKCQ